MNSKTAPAAFTGKSGKLYVRVRRVEPLPGDAFTTRIAVYPSEECYNNRSSRPDFEELSTVLDDYAETVTIDPGTLTVQKS